MIRSFVSKHSSLIIVLVILWAVIGMLLLNSLISTKEQFVYALDDPYIHMAIAKNFSQYGVWGVTRYEFSSSSSSPLWTLLLSFIYLVFGVSNIAMFIMSFITANIIVIVVYHLLISLNQPAYYINITLIAMIFITTLPTVVFTGMEHILHAAGTILFVHLAAKSLEKEDTDFIPSENRLILSLSVILPAVRYESLFLIVFVCALYFVRKRPIFALSLGILAALPVFVYGLISTGNGWFWLPNSVLLKGTVPDLRSLDTLVQFLLLGLRRLFATNYILHLIILGLFLYILKYRKSKRFWDYQLLIITIFVTISLLHLFFAQTLGFYRYDLYLSTLGIFIIAIGSWEILLKGKLEGFVVNNISLPILIAIGILAVLLLGPTLDRGLTSLTMVARASRNIYEQQIQMGSFLKEYYEEEVVAANDIGAINFQADIKCIDLAGLGSLETAQNWIANGMMELDVREVTEDKEVTVAILYDSWFEGSIPHEWISVGQWQIEENIVAGSDVITFYAVNPEEAHDLILNLQRFTSLLPESVIQSGLYLETLESNSP